MEEYNYPIFDLAREEAPFHSFPDVLRAGQRAPDFTLEDAGTGAPVALSSLWADSPAVLEFGSFT